jgi:hypothetical protein
MLPSPPDIVISVRAFRIPAFFKPFMFIGSMIYNKIHNDFYAPFFCFQKKAFHVCHCSKLWINCIIVTYVITIICIRRFIYRRKPDNTCAKSLYLIKPGNNTRNITKTVIWKRRL